MLIKRTSMLTGIEHELEINVTEDQLARWKGGEKIQNVMPHLSADDREFLMTGATPEEWDECFGEKEDK